MPWHYVLLAAAAASSAAYAIELHPLSPSFGLEMRGLNRDDLSSTATHKTLRAAFATSRGLLLVRGLHDLSCDELIALSNIFGDVEAAPADGSYETLVDEAGRVHEFATVPSSGVFQGEAQAGDWQYDAATGTPSWHTDQSFRSPRPKASAMYCLETPGGDVGQTVFCSTVAACEDLPEQVRSKLATLRAAHSYEQLSVSFQRFAGGTTKTLSAARKKSLSAPALHYLVENGALYLAPHAISHVVDDAGAKIPRDLVDALATRCTRPEYLHAHAWAPGDYVVWNNMRTMHAATGVPASASKRRMWRTTALPRGDDGDDAGATVSVTASRARAVAMTALERSGSCRPQAAAAADAFVAAEIDGRAAHGLRRVGEVCDALERGDVAVNPDVRVHMDQKSVVVRVDGGRGLAFAPLRDAVDAVAAAAETHGAAVGIVSNTRSVSGRLAPWVERLAERGLVAVLACNTPAYLAVEGGGAPCLGTNPIAWACPRNDGPPVVVDLALGATSRAAIEVAAAAGTKLPRGVAIDADGKPTRDAAAALDGGAQLPAGGIKGALLALLVEVLAGGLAGGDLAVDSNDYHTMDRSLFLLVIDPSKTTGHKSFDVGRLLERFRGRAGAAARFSREASARPDGDHDIRVSAAVWFDLQRRARAAGDVSDLEGVLPLD